MLVEVDGDVVAEVVELAVHLDALLEELFLWTPRRGRVVKIREGGPNLVDKGRWPLFHRSGKATLITWGELVKYTKSGILAL